MIRIAAAFAPLALLAALLHWNEPVICEGPAFVASQEGLERLEGCTVVAGSLDIEGPDVHDLSPLSSLVRVNGALLVRHNPGLRSLRGLDGLVEVRGSLHLTANGLASLEGLGGLERVGGDLVVLDNPHLAGTDALHDELRVTGQRVLKGNGGDPRVAAR